MEFSSLNRKQDKQQPLLTTVRSINAALRASEQGNGRGVFALKNGVKFPISKADGRSEPQA